MNRWLLIIILAFILYCQKESPPSSSAENPKLTVISPHTKDVLDNFDQAFKKYYQQRTGASIQIEWIDQGGSSDDLKFIKSEFTRNPDGIDIDLFWGGGVTPHLMLLEDHLLYPLEIDSLILSNLPRELAGMPLYDPKFHWYGTCLSAFGVIYNKMVLQQLNIPQPVDWKSLADPVYCDWIAIPDIRHSGSIEMMFHVILSAYGWNEGWDVLTRICANAKRFTLSSIDVIKDITTGDAACALCVDYYAWKQIEDHGLDKIGYLLPNNHSVINPDCISVLKGLPHPENSRIFIEFLLSEQGQSIFYLPHGHPNGPPESSLNRLAIVPFMYEKYQSVSVIPINPFDNQQMVPYDAERIQQIQDVFKDLCGVLFIDNHTSLKRAWNALLANPSTENERAFSLLPIDSTSLYQYAKAWKTDEVFRNEQLNAWTKFAINKYDSILK